MKNPTALLLLTLAGLFGTAHAAPAAEATLPFDFQMEQTTLEQAEAYWAAHDMRELSHGNLAMGTGSGVDGANAGVAAEKVVLIDIANTDFEGPRTVRFGFYDGKLYLLQAVLKSYNPQNTKNITPLSDAEIEALHDQLMQKYGKPAKSLRSMFAGKKPDLFIWELGPSELTLSTSVLQPSLVLTNRALSLEVARYKKTVCNKSNRSHCW